VGIGVRFWAKRGKVRVEWQTEIDINYFIRHIEIYIYLKE
jgi:hypothetical protein